MPLSEVLDRLGLQIAVIDLYEWNDDRNGYYLYDVTAANEIVDEKLREGVAPIWLNVNSVDFTRMKIDKGHARTLTEEHLARPIVVVPAGIGDNGEQEHLIIDGRHRAVRARMLGRQYIFAYVFTREEERKVRLHGAEWDA